MRLPADGQCTDELASLAIPPTLDSINTIQIPIILPTSHHPFSTSPANLDKVRAEYLRLRNAQNEYHGLQGEIEVHHPA